MGRRETQERSIDAKKRHLWASVGVGAKARAELWVAGFGKTPPVVL